jgi:Protein of unknown function (DUF2867)
VRPPVAATVQAQTVGKEAGSFVRMTPHVSEVCPADFSTILPHHGFVDAFATTVETAHIDMLQQAHVIMGTAPGWVTGLMSLRNFVVKPLEQRTSKWHHLRSVSCSRFKVLVHRTVN